MSNFNAVGRVKQTVVLGPANANDAVLKAAFNGIGYAVVTEPMEIDKVVLSFAMSAGVNAAGSGSTAIGVYVNNVAAHSASFAVSYASSAPYATLDRGSLTIKTLSEGDVIRIDLLSVPGGAATSYPQGAVVTFVGEAL